MCSIKKWQFLKTSVEEVYSFVVQTLLCRNELSRVANDAFVSLSELPNLQGSSIHVLNNYADVALLWIDVRIIKVHDLGTK